MPDGPVALEESYSAVMGIVTEVEQYVKVRSSDFIQIHYIIHSRYLRREIRTRGIAQRPWV